MTATSTSIRAYHDIASTREVMCQSLLRLYIEQGPMSDREACRRLMWEAPSVVSARRNDLDGIIEMGKVKDPITGMTVKVWGLNHLAL
ncbi:hypothetical protein C4568_03670 [Candidatus Parcubacteria bacterium]|nr:MAG: hypothetical protein C4568_03670 [Candidatus Parcubacteria bacterium]